MPPMMMSQHKGAARRGPNVSSSGATASALDRLATTNARSAPSLASSSTTVSTKGTPTCTECMPGGKGPRSAGSMAAEW